MKRKILSLILIISLLLIGIKSYAGLLDDADNYLQGVDGWKDEKLFIDSILINNKKKVDKLKKLQDLSFRRMQEYKSNIVIKYVYQYLAYKIQWILDDNRAKRVAANINSNKTEKNVNDNNNGFDYSKNYPKYEGSYILAKDNTVRVLCARDGKPTPNPIYEKVCGYEYSKGKIKVWSAEDVPTDSNTGKISRNIRRTRNFNALNDACIVKSYKCLNNDNIKKLDNEIRINILLPKEHLDANVRNICRNFGYNDYDYKTRSNGTELIAYDIVCKKTEKKSEDTTEKHKCEGDIPGDNTIILGSDYSSTTLKRTYIKVAFGVLSAQIGKKDCTWTCKKGYERINNENKCGKVIDISRVFVDKKIQNNKEITILTLENTGRPLSERYFGKGDKNERADEACRLFGYKYSISRNASKKHYWHKLQRKTKYKLTKVWCSN